MVPSPGASHRAHAEHDRGEDEQDPRALQPGRVVGLSEDHGADVRDGTGEDGDEDQRHGVLRGATHGDLPGGGVDADVRGRS